MSGTLLATCSSSTVQKHFRWPQMSGILPRNVRYTQVDLYINYMTYWNVIYVYMTCSRYGWGSLVTLSWVQLTMVLSPSIEIWGFPNRSGYETTCKVVWENCIAQGNKWQGEMLHATALLFSNNSYWYRSLKSSLVVHLQVVTNTRTYLRSLYVRASLLRSRL